MGGWSVCRLTMSVLVLSVGFIGCGKTETAECKPGTVSCDCDIGSKCEGTLTCVSGKCVDLSTVREDLDNKEPEAAAGAPPVVPAVPESGGMEPAWAAYKKTLAAFARGRASAYREGFSFPMKCFYGKENYSADSFRKRRAIRGWVGTMAYENLVDEPNRVVFVDFGAWHNGEEKYSQGGHKKLIEMVRTSDGWKISAETSTTKADCMGLPNGMVKGVKNNPRWSRCKQRHARSCKGCGQTWKTYGMSNGTMMCASSCACELEQCMFGRSLSGVCELNG